MMIRRCTSPWLLLLAACLLSALAETGQADDISAVEYQRQTIYHSPQKPGFTSWVGAWTMPDGSLMVSFTQATGPVEGRPQAPKEVQHKLTWPPPGHPGYDMTGLDLRNVHLASTDAGKTWQQVSADGFKSCMNGVTNEAQTALADGTILRGVFGFYLPYDPDLPQTGFLQRSSDGTKTWGKPEVPIDAAKFSTWPRRIRVLRDGRIVLLVGVAQAPAGSQTRAEFSAVVEPALLISSDQGRSWKGPVPATLAEQRGGWTEEFDIAELPNGDLLTIYRRANDTKRWQSTLKKSDETWIAQRAGPSVLPHSGQPELLATREGPILHVATNGIHWTRDAGQTWNKLNVPGTAYYPRSVQTKDGRIFVFGHVGGDDAYGKADQSIVMDSFRLVATDITVTDRKSLPTDKLVAERIPLGEADDYKPCIAKLPSGELLLTAFHQHKRDGNKVMEQTLLFRSPDGGRTWTGPQPLDLLGREPYLTVLKNGTVFITGHLLAQDVRNEWGYTTGFLHRSTDGGRTWQSTRVESEQVKPKASNHTTRNVLEMSDGSLLLGVDYDGGGGPYFVWRSTDGGQTWDKSQRCEPRDFKSQYGFFGGETWLWQARSGKVWALVRVDSNELPIKDRPIKAGNDQADHFILFSSADAGKTFDRIRDFGDYGEMYMALLRLHDKRLLLTFTVRDLKPPLGVRALIGTETDDGFEFDFAHDRIQLDTKTPVGKPQGGGFGPSVQLDDGTLATSYSYRGEDGKSHLEVARWKPPSNERELIGYWKLQGDCRDHSGNNLHGTNHGVDLKTGRFDGRSEHIEVPTCEALQLGTSDFTISARVRTDKIVDDTLGDVLSLFDPKTRRGITLNLKASSGGYQSSGDDRHVDFGIDNGKLGEWQDCGRPNPTSNYVSNSLTVFDGHLYAATIDAKDEADWCHVYRYAGEKKWIDCGRVGTRKTTGVMGLIVHQGHLYAGTSTYDWTRVFSGEYEPARVYRYEGGTNWTDCGQPSEMLRINCMATFGGKLYVGGDRGMPPPGEKQWTGRPYRVYVWDGGTKWSVAGDLPAEPPKNCYPHAMTVHDGKLFVGYPNVWSFDGRQWEFAGTPIGNTPLDQKPLLQVHSLSVFRGKLLAGMWPEARVVEHQGGEQWTDRGRLGDGTEINALTVYNGKLYAGAIPRGEVSRYDDEAGWTSLHKFFSPPGWEPGPPTAPVREEINNWTRVTSLTVYQGLLFASIGSCTSSVKDAPAGVRGSVYSLKAGECISYDKDLGSDWQHLVAQRRGGQLRLYVAGKLVAQSAPFKSEDYDLSTKQPLRIGLGEHDAFTGQIQDVRLYRRALSETEIQALWRMSSQN